MFPVRFPWICVSLLLVAACASELWACPTCKDNIAANGQNLVQGYFWSILFMMSMPFLILGGLSTYFYLEVRRARRRQAAGAIPAVASVGKPLAGSSPGI